MAILHNATLTPGKLDLVESWLPAQEWYPGESVTGLERVGSARLDDPAGAVGVEIMLVRAPGGPLTQVAMTYRDAPLDGAERWLVGTAEHSVLGTRWVYDAVGDPVYVALLVETIRTGGSGATEYLLTPDGPVERESSMTVRGSGTQTPAAPAGILGIDDGDPAVIRTEVGALSVYRLAGDAPAGSASTLTGTWAAGTTTLAALR